VIRVSEGSAQRLEEEKRPIGRLANAEISRERHYLIVIPNGVAIRNFFCTRFLDLLLESGSVTVWHSLEAEDIEPFRHRWDTRVSWEVLPPVHDRLVERVLRQAKGRAQVVWQTRTDPTVPRTKRHLPSRWRARALENIATGIAWVCANPRRLARLDRLHQRVAAGARHMNEFETALRRWRPDVVFCAHQKSIQAVPAILAARKLGIPTATFIYSWDNLPKGRMPINPSDFLVWSEFMKRELLAYHPDVSPNRVHVAGTPQFETYRDASLVRPRDEFLRKVGLDPSRPVICFSGDDVLTSPHDPRYLADLADSMRAIDASQRPQILFRPSPIDQSGRYDAVLAKYPEVALSTPCWTVHAPGDWSQVVPQWEDIALLVNVVYHSDLVVNVGSTMAMDFAACDKPAVYIAYDPEGIGRAWSIQDLYRKVHFRTVHALQPLYWARSSRELGTVVLHALLHPKEKSEARQAWLSLHVRHPLDRASERFASWLRTLSDASPWRTASRRRAAVPARTIER
jgi:hypothetical protein